MKRIAVIDNTKLKDMGEKRRIEQACNSAGIRCAYFEGEQLRIDEQVCTDMLAQICAKAAPYAIKVVNLPDVLDKEPVHRFGKNQFALFNLPVPVYGKLLGIIGKNGIGKSTAIKIISGEIKASSLADGMTRYDLPKELQVILKNVHEKKILVSLKKQQITELTDQGNVHEFLKANDQKGQLDTYIETLELRDTLEKNLDELSGGELQRVAIAAAASRKADIYFFDEPTSYLDINQRFRVAKFIYSLVNAQTAVVVIEHDFIVVDYICDLVQIFYGSAGIYGVVSGAKNPKNGINEYLQGYLSAENIRIRDKPIRFLLSSDDQDRKGAVQLSWSNIHKTLGSFELVARDGQITDKDIIGVLGRNAIGKTTFAKLIAGVETPDSGTISQNTTISYKPQYLQASSESVVRDVLAKATRDYYPELIVPLDIEALYDQKLSQLSGGELQRVAIAHCLSQDATTYLLDEPSAFLDIEQRLLLARILREVIGEGKSGLVIDHDLLFLDYISQRLLIFDGMPARFGEVHGPFQKKDGMNIFLEGLEITFRRDPQSGMARINKPGSVLDRKQKSEGNYYFT